MAARTATSSAVAAAAVTRRAAAATVGAVLLVFASLVVAPTPTAASAVDVAFTLGGPPVGPYRADTDGLDLRDDYPVTTHRGGGLPATPDGAAAAVQRFSRADHLVAHVPLDDGDYTVSLLFAEVYAAACHRRGRVFDISLLSGAAASGSAGGMMGGAGAGGGTEVGVADWDTYTAAGGCRVPVVKTFPGVDVTGGAGLTLVLSRVVQNPTLAAIRVTGYSRPGGRRAATPWTPPTDAALADVQ